MPPTSGRRPRSSCCRPGRAELSSAEASTRGSTATARPLSRQRWEYGPTTAYGLWRDGGSTSDAGGGWTGVETSLRDVAPGTDLPLPARREHARGCRVQPGRDLHHVALRPAQCPPSVWSHQPLGNAGTGVAFAATVDGSGARRATGSSGARRQAYGTHHARRASCPRPTRARTRVKELVTGLVPGKTYCYRVVAENAAGARERPRQADVFTYAGPSTPDARTRRPIPSPSPGPTASRRPDARPHRRRRRRTRARRRPRPPSPSPSSGAGAVARPRPVAPARPRDPAPPPPRRPSPRGSPTLRLTPVSPAHRRLGSTDSRGATGQARITVRSGAASHERWVRVSRDPAAHHSGRAPTRCAGRCRPGLYRVTIAGGDAIKRQVRVR